MVRAILTILAGVASALPQLVEIYREWRAGREERERENDLELFDKALYDGDVLELASMFDSLQREL